MAIGVLGTIIRPHVPLKTLLIIVLMLIFFLMLIFVAIAASAARYFWLEDGHGTRQTADRSSAVCCLRRSHIPTP
jgi:hypothetical protein